MRDIHILLTEQEEVVQFIALMKMLNAAHRSLNFEIPEITYFKYFSPSFPYLPLKQFPYEPFTSKDIILSTVNRYKEHKKIYKNSRFFDQKFVFVCEGNSVTVGFNMSFYFDVLFICCLHCIACCNSYTKGIKILIDIMTRKYNLKCEYDNTITEDEQALTLYRISLCFPSVTISACTAIQPSFSTSILSNFPNLPVELLNPYILYIMPLKCYGTPHELLICIKILLREYWSECEKLPLQTYNKIFDVACSNYVFPFKLKWKLLRKWKIVKKDGTFSYRFVDNVQMYNRDAKPLIRYLKERDSSLKERELSGQNDQKNSVNYQYIFSPFLQMYSG